MHSESDLQPLSPLDGLMLALFRWFALVLAVLSAAGLVIALGLLAFGSDRGGGRLERATLDVFMDRQEAGEVPAAPRTAIFTYAPEDTREAAYQDLYNRVLDTARRYDMLSDPQALVDTVNGAIKEFDLSDHPDDGTFAYVYLTRLNALAETLAARRNTGTVPETVGLESVAEWLRAEVREAMLREAAPASGRSLLADRGALAFLCAIVFLVSSTVWAVLTAIAQGRAVWDGPHEHID